MVSLEEYAKIGSLISSCNDIINGKFILADYKIANILKHIANSKEVYNLLASYLSDFDFEREFSRAQFKNVSHPNKFVLPEAKEKLLPFVFCVLVNINNKDIELDSFIHEFFPVANGDHSKEFAKFAHSVIVPFRDLIAEHFEVSKENPKKEEENMKEKNIEEYEEETTEELFEDQEELDEEYDEEEYEDEEKNYPELTAERVENFFEEIKANAEQMLSELPYERKLSGDVQEDAEYVLHAIIDNCESNDLKNTIALITALDYVVAKAKTIKFYIKEMKKILVELYD